MPAWYFAYGSNMQAATFHGRRGIGFTRALPARLGGWRLVLDKPPLVPIGEGFANLVSDEHAEVLGVLYEVTDEELAHIDFTEGVLIGNYRRIEVTVAPLAEPAGEVAAFTLVSDRRDPSLRPSARYMACLIGGAEEHGLPAAYVTFLRGVATCRESADALQWRGVLDDVLRRRR